MPLQLISALSCKNVGAKAVKIGPFLKHAGRQEETSDCSISADRTYQKCCGGLGQTADTRLIHRRWPRRRRSTGPGKGIAFIPFSDAAFDAGPNGPAFCVDGLGSFCQNRYLQFKIERTQRRGL